MHQEAIEPVQVTIKVAGNHADRAAVQSVASALRAALELPGPAGTVDATIIVEITEHVVSLEATTPNVPNNSTESRTRHTDRMRLAKEQYSRAYRPWNESEEQRLRELHDQGCTIEQISTELQRQPGGIRSRLDKLQLA